MTKLEELKKAVGDALMAVNSAVEAAVDSEAASKAADKAYSDATEAADVAYSKLWAAHEAYKDALSLIKEKNTCHLVATMQHSMQH